MKKILVTGAEGFIGSHLTEELLGCGYKVRAFVLYNSFNSVGWLNQIRSNKNLEIYFGDIRDSENISNALNGCDQVVNLAALISIPYSFESSKLYVDTNIYGTLNILNAAKKKKLEKIIITSTSEVFGSCKKSPMDEMHPLNSQSPYAASKTSADQLAKSFHASFDLPIVILRPFNTFGPRQSLKAIIPTIITQALKKPKNIKLGNINTARDFNYVKDITSAFLNVIESQNKKIYGQDYNIGSGKYLKISEIIKIISSILKVKLNVNFESKRLRPKQSEVLKLIADNTKFKKEFNWAPKFSKNDKHLIQSFRETIKWYEKNLDQFKSFKNYNY